MTMATRIAVMSEGKVLQIGSPGDVYETPATRFVADFLGNVNLMEGRVEVDEPDHAVVRCADCTHYVGHGITGTLEMAVAVAVRPEKIALHAAEPHGPLGEHNKVSGTIKELSYFGSFTVYHLALQSGAVLKIRESNVSRHRDNALTWGDSAWASWAPTAQVVLTQ